MELQTNISIPKSTFEIKHSDRILSLGSCFSENIGRLFQQHKFPIHINPFGQQYNPLSIANALNRLLNPVPYKQADLIEHNELYNSFHHHSDFSKPTTEKALTAINQELATASEWLKQTKFLFLTFGTAHYFRLKENQQIVSNCHKIPANNFVQQLASPQEIIEALEIPLKQIQTINPNIQIIFTVSPVRYFAFGAFENSVSKGHLFSAIHSLIEANKSFSYFPAYELIIDQLRDYRFYANDMIHPSDSAIQFVWEKMSAHCFSGNTQSLNKEIETICRAANHRPRYPFSEAHQSLIKKTMTAISVLETQFSLDFSAEMTLLSSHLSN